MPNPSIVLASLDDEKLRQSITNLVAHVKRATHTMLTDTNSTVDAMEKKLKSLGNIKIGSGGTNDGGVSKHTKAQNADTEAIEKNIAAQDRQIKKNQEVAMTFDQKAAAIQKASRMPSEMRPEKPETRARDSYYAFVAGLKEQRDSLAKVINDFERGLNNAISKRTNEINNQITASKNKIQELNQELNRANATRNEARASQVQGQLDKELRHYKDLESQLKNVNNEFGTSKISLAAMNAEHHRLANLMREETSSTQQQAQAQQQQITLEQKRTEEIHKQISAIAGRKDATKAFEQISLMPSNTMDEIKAKGQALVELVKKVKDTPLMSQSNVKLAEKMIGSLANQYRALKVEKEKVANTATTNAAAENTTRRSFEQEKQDLERLKALQEERRQQIIQTGIAAQQQAQNLRESIGQQMQAADYTKQVDNVKELQNALTAMKNALKQPIDSSIKKALEEDIAKTEKALDIAKRYNMTVAGMGAVGVGGKAPTDTLAAYSAEVQRLAGIYRNLSTEERNASAGQGLKKKYQELSQTASQVRKELERPINLKDALSGSEKTLDDIARKIQRLQSYKRGIDITDPKQAGELRTVDAEINRLTKDLNKYMSTTRQASEVNNALSRSWNYMKNRLAFYFSVGASTQFIKNLIEVRSQYELNERALGILIGSAERGTQIFNELSQMALVSPYTLIELSSAAKQLTAYDVAARDVVDTTRRLADMASAVGVPMERLTYALGQIKAYGYLNSRDNRMFANAGIPLVKQLADYYTELEGRMVSTADVYDRIKKKAVDYNTVMQVIYRMTDEGGKFFDFQAKMADTLKVRLANLTLAWNNMLNDMGKETQGVLTGGIGALRTLFLHWRTLDSLIKNTAWVVGLRTAFMLLAYGVLKLGGALGVTTRQMALSAVFGKRLAGVLRTVGMTMKSIVTSPLTWWSLLALAATEAAIQIFSANEATVSLNKSLREGAETNFKDISDYLAQYQKVADSLYSGKKTNNAYDLRTGKVESEASTPTDINVDEANKAWEAMRERIELSTAASDDFVGRLLTIENVSERLRQGFKLLNDIQQVNSAMRDMGDTAIVVTQDWSKWWNLFMGSDGLINNLKDYKNAQDGATFSMEKFGQGLLRQTNAVGVVYNIINGFADDEDKAFKILKSDIDDTTESIDNFIRNMGFASNPDQIAAVYAQALKQISAQGNLDPQTAYDLQQGVEEARGKAMKEALEARIADEEAALKLAHDNETKASLSASKQRHEAQLELFTKYTEDERSEWERFTKYMKENHISEMQAMFGQMDEEQIKSINWQEGKYLDFVKRTAAAYAKRHNMAYGEVFNRLWGLINQTNLMQIFLKLTISTEEHKSFSAQLKEYDQMANDAYTNLKRIQERIAQLAAAGAKSTLSKYHKEYLALKKEEDDLLSSYKDYTSIEKGGKSSKEEQANAKAAKAASAAKVKSAREAAKAQREGETELQKAIKDTLQLIDKERQAYEKLTKAGVTHSEAITLSTQGYEGTLEHINAVFKKNGMNAFDPKLYLGKADPHVLLKYLEDISKQAKQSKFFKSDDIKELELKIKDLRIDAKSYDSEMLVNGLNHELGKLKDEYELAIELDADPEFGNIFANWMGIDMDNLPRTAKEYADKYTAALDKYFQEQGANIDLPNLLDIKDEYFDLYKANGITEQQFNLIKDGVKAVRDALKKEMEDTSKTWNGLIEKYGDLQSKLLKIYKESVQGQLGVIRKFGTEDEKHNAVDLVNKIKISDNPSEINRLSGELNKIVDSVTKRNPAAVKVALATQKEADQRSSKAYWDDFKDSDLYAMAFEDMSHNSVRAIQLIMDRLDGLKDKVKEDPASMKALMKSLEDAEKELNAIDPFGGIIRSIKAWGQAAKETEIAQRELKDAEKEVELAQQGVDEAEDASPEEQARAKERLTKAVNDRAAAEIKLTKAENKGKKAQENLKDSLKGVASQLGNVKDLFDTVSKLFRAGGDDETADAIDAISEGFATMTTIIMGVVAAMILLESTQPWLLAIAAALSLIIGLVSFLSESDNKKIDKQIKESEMQVKRLENTYKNLEFSVEQAYGTMAIGARQAAIANKELQLVELKRQLALEKSRDSKHRDKERILDIQGQIIDLKNEIIKSYQEIATDLLGISSVADAAESMMDAYIAALRSGEDAMESFEGSVKDMVANVIKKLFVTKVIAPELERLVDDMNERITNRSSKEAKAYEEAVRKQSEFEEKYDDDALKFLYDVGKWNGSLDDSVTLDDYIKAVRAPYEEAVKQAKKELDRVATPTLEDIDLVAQETYAMIPALENMNDDIVAMLQRYDLIESDLDKTGNLSALQQGIQGITEDQAGALEAYWNINTQEQFKHTTLLTQIRDLLSGSSGDVQIGVQAQMLLQLQQSYQVQMSIHSTLQGWTNPSGQAVRVELIS